LETLTGYKRFKHGEAIAIGMDYAARLSYHLGLCPLELVRRQQHLLEALGLPTRLPRVHLKRLVEIMAVDKKVQQGRIHFVLPTQIGHVVVEPVEERYIIKVLR
jgi:3-dehydroquinate synthase